MARSLAEIDADIAEVQARLAKRNEGIPQRSNPEYRAARFDYIVEGDRSGLDAYQNALNAAIQNKLSRESSERMLKAGKEQANEEAMDQWQKDYSFAKSAQSEIYNNPASTQKQKDDADATVRYYESVGNRKGYLSKYKTMTAAPAAPAATETPKEAQKETFKQLMGRGQTLEKDEDIDAWIEDVKKYTGNDAVVGEAYEGIGKAQEKKKANETGRWNEYNSRVKAALGEKDYNKRKAALEPLKEELGKYKGQEKYAEVEKSINDGLKKPAKDPLNEAYIKDNYTTSKVMVNILPKLREKGSFTENVTVNGRNRTIKFSKQSNGDVTVSNESGKVIKRWKASELDNDKPEQSKEAKPEQKPNQVASVLGAGKNIKNRVIVGAGEDW